MSAANRSASEVLSDLAAVASEVARLEARRAHLHTELAEALTRPIDAPPRFLTTAEAAELLGVSASHLAQLRARGEGPACVRVGRAIRYPFDGKVVGRES